MKLIELDSRWIDEHVFAFRCPHCRVMWLTCKDVAMNTHDQMVIAEREIHDVAVLCDSPTAWKISGRDFTTMSVTPSLDASKSGHWHGFITNGEIR